MVYMYKLGRKNEAKLKDDPNISIFMYVGLHELKQEEMI